MVALIVLLQALFASVFPIGKKALAYAGPFFLVGLRMVLAGATLFIYQLIKNPKACIIRRQDIPLLIVLAFLNVYMVNSYEFWGLQYLTSGKACFIYNLSPFFAALFSYVLFHEKITFKKGLGLVIGFLGFLPILYGESKTELSLMHVGMLSIAEIALLLAAFADSAGWVVMRIFSRHTHYSFITVNAYGMMLGGLMSFAHSLSIESWTPSPYTAFLPMLSLTILMGLIQNIICYNLYAHLLRQYSSTFISFIGFTGPFFAAFLGWLMFGEMVSWYFYVSAAIVFTGLCLFYQEELRQGYIVSHKKAG